ncbi:MAG: glycerophosphodiester phosphodiesterase family protein [Pseudomonadota bacterium]
MIETGYPNVSDNGRVIAHRGASQVAPENTLAAFREASEQGVQWVEFDVSLLGDLTPVVHHDDTLDRCTSASGPVRAKVMSDLANITAGKLHGDAYADEPIPTLDAALDLFEGLGMYANLEMKRHDNQSGALAERVHAALTNRIWARDRIIVSSFDHTELHELRERMPDIPIAALWREPSRDFRNTLNDLKAAAAHIHYAHLSQSLLQDALSFGFDLRVYTINDPNVVAPFRELGLTSVITDHPPLYLDDADWAEWAEN